MYLLVGLGNPGKVYEDTRHNVGFQAVDAIIGKYRLSAAQKKWESEVYKGDMEENIPVIVLKPMTFMNNSGVAVQKACQFYKVSPSDIIVFHDELDLTVGTVRVKTGGGNAGHNGLKSIDQHIGKAYQRVRIGIGHPGEKGKVTGHVLGRFFTEEEGVIEKIVKNIAAYLPYLLNKENGRFIEQVTGHP